MTSDTVEQGVESRQGTAVIGDGWTAMGLLVLALLWLQYFAALAPTWADGTYYSYGWIVPILACWAFVRRWRGETDKLPVPTSPARRKLLWVCALLAIIAIHPTRVLELSDPRWRIPLWIHGFVVIGFSLAAFFILVRRNKALGLLWVLILAATAVPWPTALEIRLVDGLTGLVMKGASFVMLLMGFSVEVEGVVLIVEGKPLEIDKTCSGIRSFQSLLMCSVFVGELWRLAPLGRLALLVVGLAIAIVTNLIRIVYLTQVFVEDGDEAFHVAHDGVGFLSFGIAALVVLLAGKLLDSDNQDAVEE
jgi:exosortase